ncbi:hypothetical protein MMC22_003722 [Lobaria immixta]|nr:hypothetical protein [Lobaria immixta]
MKFKYKIGATRDVDDFPDHHSPTSIKATAKKRPHFVGWRFGIISGSVSVFVVLVLNLSFTLWTLSRGGIENQRGILHDGDCDEVRKLNIVAHLIINIFSTVILASSNYCMQCLSAPTRAEINKEHAQGKWLDVGIPSLRNLRRISRKRALLWILLGVSSLPLHLFYNSVIFASISTNIYEIVSVNREFIDATSLEGVNRPNSVNRQKSDNDTISSLYQAARNSLLERMDNSRCIQAYAHDYLSDRSDLLLIGSDENSTSTPTVFFTGDVNYFRINQYGSDCVHDMYAWICPSLDCLDPCQAHLQQVLADTSHWKPQQKFDIEVDFCLSQRTPERCKLQFSLHIVIVVIVINTLKMILMLYVVFGLKETPLMTIGDAIASFLNKEDPTTKGCCLISKFDIKQNKLRWQYREGESNGPPAKAWLPIKVPWARAVSRTRWLSLAVTVCAGLLGWGISAIRGPKDIGTLWKLGLGAVSTRTLINWESTGGPSTLVGNVLVANIAQPILSFIYFTYNGIFTCMLAEREWNQFARKMGGLRISSIPCGSQRSSYFLQLPYRFAIPIMVLSGVLHWFVSQSIFLVAIETYDQGVRVDYRNTHTRATQPDQLSCGYSPIAIIFVIILVLVMMLFGIGTGLKRYDPGIPVAGSCSVVLSAACHVEDEDTASSEMALKPLQWGVVRSGDGDEVGHCAFSTAKVTFPQESSLYAGKP